MVGDDKMISVHLIAEIVKGSLGWRIELTADDGTVVVGEEKFPTKEEAEAAILNLAMTGLR